MSIYYKITRIPKCYSQLAMVKRVAMRPNLPAIYVAWNVSTPENNFITQKFSMAKQVYEQDDRRNN